MNWNQLLSTQRTGQEFLPSQIQHARTQFQRDYDRLIFSSPFRRLQDKTQVFPLPGSVFVHNRLTHSLEVASVGRSLGNNLSRFLLDRNEGSRELVEEIGSVVAAACLAHDMGNPPFGHSGEEAISHYFKHGEGKKYEANLTPQEWTDLTNFEGNANALRLLTNTFKGRRTGGFSLTYTTLASIVKYPYPSGTGQKKSGFFQAEKETYEQIAAHLGLQCQKDSKAYFARHPLVYLVEAADDICYQLMDFEDALKLRIINYEETISLLMAFFDPDQNSHEQARIRETLIEVTDSNERVAYLRAKAIGKLVDHCSRIFEEHHTAILSGTFTGSLIDYLPPPEKRAMERCKKEAFSRVYRHPSVVEIEISGFKILGTLLHEFIEAVQNPNRYYSKILLPFIPEQFKTHQDASVYEKLLSVTDLISGMTDVYALDLYRKINGIGLSTKN